METELYNKEGKKLTVMEALLTLPFVTPLETVTRVEVVDRKGRSYVNRKATNKTEISLQDGGRTLKIFITE